jgi:dTDP-glucose pyrophosphorylase
MDNSLKGFKLRPSSVWLDAGTPSSLLMSSEYVRSYQERTGMPIGSPEYSAYEAGLISQDKFSQLVSEMPESYYKNLLRELT